MSLTLYGGARSRASMPRWYMAERGIPYSWTVLDLEAGEHRAEPFTAINPFGKVPALVDEDPALPGGRLQLFESGAILEYLAETRAPQFNRPAGHPDRICYLEWLHFGETAAVHLANLTQQHIVLREAHMRSETVMRLEAKRLEKCLIAAARARKGEGVCGAFSAADVALGYAVLIGQYFLRYQDPALVDWLAALKARPALQAARVEDGPVQIYTRDFYEAPLG